MRKSTITLVHSNEPSQEAKIGREQWGFENARQLGFFDDFEKTIILIVATGEQSAHSFTRILSKHHPETIVDTRAFPDFFRIFESTSVALESLKNQGIEYLRAPVSYRESGKNVWEQLSKFQELVDRTNENHPSNAPIIVLVSTDESKGKLKSRLEGYVLQNMPNASFLEA